MQSLLYGIFSGNAKKPQIGFFSKPPGSPVWINNRDRGCLTNVIQPR